MKTTFLKDAENVPLSGSNESWKLYRTYSGYAGGLVRRLKPSLLPLFLLTCSLASFKTPAAPETSIPRDTPPNVLFILVDDLGWADLESYGSSFYRTPHVDDFARESLRFVDAYSPSPVCSPARAALLTGRHPVRSGITDWIPGRQYEDRPLATPEIPRALPGSETTLAEIFRDHGYATGFIGKWHLGGEGSLPTDHGFDINIGGNHRGQPASYYSPYKNPYLTDGPEGEYLPDRLTDEAIAYMADHAGRSKPFLLWLSYYTVHSPFQAAPRHLAEAEARAAALSGPDLGWGPEGSGQTKLRQDRPDYASMVEAMDDNIGRLLKALDALNLSPNTLVVFTSDNGGLSTARGKWLPTSNLPLRAGKGWCYEGGIRVPLILRFPGRTLSGSLSRVPVRGEDLFPTLLRAAGLPLPEDIELDGVDLSPVVGGAGTLARDTMYWHYPHYHGSAWTPGSALRQGDWKLVHFYEGNRTELYNLRLDPGEQNDLARKYPEHTARLLGQLKNWQSDLKAKIPEPVQPSSQK